MASSCPLQNAQPFGGKLKEINLISAKNGSTIIDRLAVGVPYSDKSNIKRWTHTKGRDLRCRGNNWFIPYETIVSRSKQRPHPATFPTELAIFCLNIHGGCSDLTVLDPFLGIGHAALAAKKSGARKFIGIDIDREYVRVARNAVRTTHAKLDEDTGNSTKGIHTRERTLFDD